MSTHYQNKPVHTKPQKPIAIAVAGAGQIGKRHIELVLANPRLQLHSIIDPSQAAKAYAAQCSVAYFETLDVLFAAHNAPPDGIVLATPNALHVPQALQCLQHSIPTLVEKPIATTVEAAQQLVNATRNNPTPLMVGHHRRHSGIMAAACEVIASGVLGRLVSVVGTALFYKAENEGYFDPEWRRTAGGGPILLNMIHEIGNLRALCGDIVAVHAMTSNATRGFAVEDTASITLRFANGALGSFMLSDTAASSRSWEHTSGEDPRYHLSTVQDDDCYVVAGTMGSLSIPSMRLKTYASAADQSWHKALQTQIIRAQTIDPMAAQMDHFCDVIQGKTLPFVSALDGLNNLRIVEAIAQSGQTGQIVSTA